MSKVPISVRNTLLSKHKVFGRREYKLVKSRLQDGEYIKDSVYGTYQGGSGLLVVTNKRVLVVDRRPFFDYIEHASYEAISNLSYTSTLSGGVLHIRINRTFFRFRSFNEARIRAMHELLQKQLSDTKEQKQFSLAKQIDAGSDKGGKVIKPLRRRARRHPGWSPHNPIMTGVLYNSGVKLTKD